MVRHKKRSINPVQIYKIREIPGLNESRKDYI